MSLTLLIGLALALVVVLGLVVARRGDLCRQGRGVAERAEAVQRGSAQARLQYPEVDLSRCIGCGLCVEACPEEGVLQMLHGQAMVVHGARCVGHGLCAKVCPAAGIVVTLGDLSERRDIPALTQELEAVGLPGVFLAGEVTGYALIRTAIGHGTAVAGEVARRKGGRSEEGLDLVIVGAGPAGLACALEARRQGLSFAMMDQEGLGGTVSRYPRRKLVMTQPVELPLAGKLERSSYSKEELVEIWERAARENELPLFEGRTFTALEPVDGGYLVHAGEERWSARHVCLALGRRGSPRKLGVPGEELGKVAYSLLDAQSYRGRRVLVVGGGDSAIEAAVGLAEQPGNEVTLSYRRPAFFRLKARNEARLSEAIEGGQLVVLYGSQVRRIGEEVVELTLGEDPTVLPLPNDDVFVLAGGVPPFELLERSGVSFDPALRPEPELAGRESGLITALIAALVLVLGALAWVVVCADYYMASFGVRAELPQHQFLRPSRGIGLALGLAAGGLLLVNLAYLARRSLRVPFEWGSLQRWMTAHVATGIACLACALLHAALAPRDTVGGHALWGLALLVVTGAIGRYLYAFVPRAANGRELELEEVRGRLAELSGSWDRVHRGFGEQARAEVQQLVERGRWTGGFLSRLATLLGGQRRLKHGLARIERAGRGADLPEDQLAQTLDLARRAYRTALAAAHYEELRGLLAGWRYLHRWAALAVVLLVVAHVVTALRYAQLLGGGA